MKTAIVFSGQGAQYPGMGKALYERYDAFRRVFQQADSLLHFSLEKICFESGEDLNKTAYTQPAIFTMSMGVFALLNALGIQPDYLAGFSLGEYSALCAGGAYTFEDLLPVVEKRGRYMAEAVPESIGVMWAIMGLGPEIIEEVCAGVTNEGPGLVQPANYNMPEQTVIAGHKDAVAKAGALLLAKGAKKAVPLNVSGPFHTSLMAPAGEKLYRDLTTLPLNPLNTPVVANVTGQVIEAYQTIPDLLQKQVMSPVLWRQSVEELIRLGADTFIEAGPGRTLSAFIKRINKNVQVYHVEDIQSLEKLLAGFQIEE